MIRKLLVVGAAALMLAASPALAQECHSYKEFIADASTAQVKFDVTMYEGADAVKIVAAAKEQHAEATGNRVAVILVEDNGTAIILMQGDCMKAVARMPNEIAKMFIDTALGRHAT